MKWVFIHQRLCFLHFVQAEPSQSIRDLSISSMERRNQTTKNSYNQHKGMSVLYYNTLENMSTAPLRLRTGRSHDAALMDGWDVHCCIQYISGHAIYRWICYPSSCHIQLCAAKSSGIYKFLESWICKLSAKTISSLALYTRNVCGLKLLSEKRECSLSCRILWTPKSKS